MKSAKQILKHTFYPDPEVAEALKDAPAKKLSLRVNELILKGLSKEKEEALRVDYERYDREVAKSPSRKRDAHGVSTAMMLSEPLFDPDDSDQDLF